MMRNSVILEVITICLVCLVVNQTVDSKDFSRDNPRKQLVLVPKYVDLTEDTEATNWQTPEHTSDYMTRKVRQYGDVKKGNVSDMGIWFGPRLGRLHK